MHILYSIIHAKSLYIKFPRIICHNPYHVAVISLWEQLHNLVYKGITTCMYRFKCVHVMAPCRRTWPAYSSAQSSLQPRGVECFVCVRINEVDLSESSFVGCVKSPFVLIRHHLCYQKKSSLFNLWDWMHVGVHDAHLHDSFVDTVCSVCAHQQDLLNRTNPKHI